MSAPDTNLEKQSRRHRGPLIGITFALLFVAGMFVWFMGWTASEGEPPTGAETQVDGRTGTTEDSGAAPAVTDAAPGAAEALPGTTAAPDATAPAPRPVAPAPAQTDN